MMSRHRRRRSRRCRRRSSHRRRRFQSPRRMRRRRHPCAQRLQQRQPVPLFRQRLSCRRRHRRRRPRQRLRPRLFRVHQCRSSLLRRPAVVWKYTSSSRHRRLQPRRHRSRRRQCTSARRCGRHRPGVGVEALGQELVVAANKRELGLGAGHALQAEAAVQGGGEGMAAAVTACVAAPCFRAP